MTSDDVIRAWKDKEYRLSLTDAELALLPEHPAGPIELTVAEMSQIVGGKPQPPKCGPNTYVPGTTPVPDPPPSTRIPDTCNTKTTKPYPKLFPFFW